MDKEQRQSAIENLKDTLMSELKLEVLLYINNDDSFQNKMSDETLKDTLDMLETLRDAKKRAIFAIMTEELKEANSLDDLSLAVQADKIMKDTLKVVKNIANAQKDENSDEKKKTLVNNIKSFLLSELRLKSILQLNDDEKIQYKLSADEATEIRNLLDKMRELKNDEICRIMTREVISLKLWDKMAADVYFNVGLYDGGNIPEDNENQTKGEAK